MSESSGFFSVILGKMGLGPNKTKPAPKPNNIEDIKSWLANRIAAELKKDPTEIKDQIPFAQLGLDSLGAINITREIETWLEMEIDLTILYLYTNITDLSDYLIEQLKLSNRI